MSVFSVGRSHTPRLAFSKVKLSEASKSFVSIGLPEPGGGGGGGGQVSTV